MSAPRRGPEILLVDDDAEYRWIARARLESAGFRCHEASDGDAALAALGSKPGISLVLLDYTMYGREPGELIARIRSQRPDVQIIGHSNMNRATDFRSRGVEAFLPKPLVVNELRRLSSGEQGSDTVHNGGSMIRSNLRTLIALAAMAGILTTAKVRAEAIFWVQGTGANSRVVRSDLNGANVSTLITSPTVADPTTIAIHAASQTLYWAHGTSNASRIMRAGLDGSGPSTVLAWPLKSDTKGIDVDSSGGMIYWAEGAGTDSRIHRAGLTGIGFESLLAWPQVSDPKAIAVDPVGGKFYWVQGSGNNSRILRANLDGTNPVTLVVWPQVSEPTGIAVDVVSGKLYSCQNTGNNSRILGANLDGSAVTTVLSWPQVVDPKSIALDLVNFKMYWAEGASTSTRVVRANLDGSSVVAIVNWPQASDIFGLDVEAAPSAPVPTVSEWGLAVLALALLTGATVVMRARCGLMKR